MLDREKIRCHLNEILNGFLPIKISPLMAVVIIKSSLKHCQEPQAVDSLGILLVLLWKKYSLTPFFTVQFQEPPLSQNTGCSLIDKHLCKAWVLCHLLWRYFEEDHVEVGHI